MSVIVTLLVPLAVAIATAAGTDAPRGPTGGEPRIVIVGPSSDGHRITEDSPGWDCRVMGNRVCGPTSGHVPGCYSGGGLVIPWRIFDDPTTPEREQTGDPLYGQLTPPC